MRGAEENERFLILLMLAVMLDAIFLSQRIFLVDDDDLHHGLLHRTLLNELKRGICLRVSVT